MNEAWQTEQVETPGDDCDCEHTEFSGVPCAVCGTTLAGSRDDVTLWPK